METEMLGLSTHARIATTALAGLLFASGAAFAQNHFGGEASLGELYNARAQERAFFGHNTYETPGDYVSSDVCVNGYRWITRNIDSYATPAQNAVPVRC
jgi:hypothetical protein